MAYLQLGVPALMILWLAVWPLRGRARWVHVGLVAGLVGALALGLQWRWPSAYAPYGLILMTVLAAAFGRRRAVGRQGAGPVWPVLLALLAAVAAWGAVGFGIKVRLPPGGAYRDLALPMAGRVLVTEGGRHWTVNRHQEVTDPDAPSLTGWRGAARAVAVEPVDGWGRAVAAPVEVRAPCGGAVAGRGEDGRLGRYLILECGGAWVVLSGLAGVAVGGPEVAGPEVAAGGVLGSGRAVVIHAQSPGTAQHPFSGDPVWIRLGGVFPTRGQVLAGQR
jgi:hypothetical protein